VPSAVQCGSDVSQGLTALAQVTDFVEHFLFGGVWLDVLPVGSQADA
jgi:hypothetical protein